MRRRRTPGTGDLSGRDVRRPVRRFRRLPGAGLRAVPAAGHQARALGQGRGTAATRRLRRHAGRARVSRWPPRSTWCWATAPPRATASTNCCRCTCHGAPRWNVCSTTTSRAAPRSRGRTRACGRASAAPSARFRSAPTTICCSWPACGSASGPASSTRASPPSPSSPRTRGAVPELAPRTVASLTAQARLQVAPQGRRQAALRGGRRATADGAARREQGRPVLRLRGRPAVDRRRSRVGTRIPVGRADHSTDEFHPFWAHDRASERQALVDFLAMVRKRLQALSRTCTSTTTRPTRRARCFGWPAATASARTMSTTCSATASSSTFIPLVRKSIRVGTENYSIKSLEPLYMGNELRSGEVTTATDSITQYARYCALRDEGRADEAAIVLKEIEDYNVYDCRSTRRLRDWMMARAIESGVPPRGPQPVRDDGVVELGDDLDRKLLQVRRRRRRGSAPPSRRPSRWSPPPGVSTSARTSRSGGATSTGSTIPSTSGPTTATSSSPRRAEIVADWHQPPKARKPQRHVRLIGEIANGELATDMYALYDPPAPAGLADDPDRRAFGSVDGGRVRQPRGAHRGRRRREAAQGRRRLRPGAVRARPRARRSTPSRCRSRSHETAAARRRRACPTCPPTP